MKQKLRTIVKAIFISFALILFSCENNDSTTDMLAAGTEVSAAKKWFKEYESNSENFNLFQNLNYDWAKAEVKENNDGLQLIIVPITEAKKDENEIWEQKLYIYKLNENNYKALLYEIYPDEENLIMNDVSINSVKFNGYITVWDIKTGFIKAAKFENDKIVDSGVAEVVSKQTIKSRSITSKAPSDPDDTDYDSCQTGGRAINLRPVYIESNNSKYYDLIYNPRGSDTRGGTYADYTNNIGGGAGGGNTASTNADIAAAIQKKINADKLDACTKAVLDKLKNLKQADIAAMIQRFNPGGSIFNINMSTGKVVFPTNLAETSKVSGSNTDISMIFSEDYIYGKGNINPPTDLSVATTMAHEVIHAYLISQLEQYKSTGTSGICDFPTVYDAFVQQKITNNKNILPDAQHELIARDYVNAIASTIEEFHTGQPVTSGYPRQVYVDMAWGGLQNTYIFNKTYPENPNHKNYKDRERIIARINTEKLGSVYGINTPVGTSCKK